RYCRRYCRRYSRPKRLPMADGRSRGTRSPSRFSARADSSRMALAPNPPRAVRNLPHDAALPLELECLDVEEAAVASNRKRITPPILGLPLSYVRAPRAWSVSPFARQKDRRAGHSLLFRLRAGSLLRLRR